MDETLYEALAAHLDRLPGGFAPSRTGAHLRLLAYLFTPEEAALAVHLTLEPDAPAAIAARAGLPPGEVALRLEEMARKGLTLSSEGPEGLRYQALPWIVGIYEMQQNRLSTGFRRRVYSYWGSIEPRAEPDTLPQMRTIPVGEAIAFQPEAMAYQQVGALVEAQTYFAVQPCICRRMARLNGRGCDAPEEVCLAFGDWARYAVRTGRAREITREEVLDILELARAAKKHGTVISFDLNFRASFWENREEELSRIFAEIASISDVLIGNEEDFQLCLGVQGPEAGGKSLGSKIDSFKDMIKRVKASFPNVTLFANTLREVKSANLHSWGALSLDGDEWNVIEPREIPVLDRIGGGDGFVGGLLYGVLKGWSAERCLQFGWATGALTVTLLTDYATPADEEQVWSIWQGNARVKR